MSSHDATTSTDLRAQILDNWRFLYPAYAHVTLIVTTHKGFWGSYYAAMIAENRDRGGRIFMQSEIKSGLSLALHELLDATSDLIKNAITAKESAKQA